MLICADSDPLALALLERQVAKLGYPFLSAVTGQRVLDCVQYPTIAAVLLSVELADQCGLAVLREIKAAPATQRLPVIVVARTGEYEVEAFAGGCIAYLIRPFSTVELARVLRGCEWLAAANSSS